MIGWLLVLVGVLLVKVCSVVGLVMKLLSSVYLFLMLKFVGGFG